MGDQNHVVVEGGGGGEAVGEGEGVSFFLGEGGEVGPGGGDFGDEGDEAVGVFGGDAAEPGGEGGGGRFAEFDGGEDFGVDEYRDVELGGRGLLDESADGGGKCAVGEGVEGIGVEEVIHKMRPGMRRAFSVRSRGFWAAGAERRKSEKGWRRWESCS